MKLIRHCCVVSLSCSLVFISAKSSAQTIFSANALGYVDLALSPGSNYITHAFTSKDPSVPRLFPTMPDGSFLSIWDSPGQTLGPTNYYTTSNGWSNPGMELRYPQGALLWVPQATTVTLSGEVFQGSFTGQVRAAGLYLLGAIPRAGFGLCSDFDTCPPTPPNETSVCKWNAALQDCASYTYYDFGGEERGWYDLWFNRVDVQLAPGEAALFYVPHGFFYVPPLLLPQPLGTPANLVAGKRTDTNFTLCFSSLSNVAYAVLRSTNLPGAKWDVVHEATTTNTVTTVTLADTNHGSAFHRLIPQGHFSLFNDARTPNRFSFQFYAPSNGTYFVERKVGSAAWQDIGTLSGITKGVASFTDSNAVATRANYRMSQNP